MKSIKCCHPAPKFQGSLWEFGKLKLELPRLKELWFHHGLGARLHYLCNVAYLVPCFFCWSSPVSVGPFWPELAICNGIKSGPRLTDEMQKRVQQPLQSTPVLAVNVSFFSHCSIWHVNNRVFCTHKRRIISATPTKSGINSRINLPNEIRCYTSALFILLIVLMLWRIALKL